MNSLQRILGVPWGLLPAARAGKTSKGKCPGGALTRCPNLLDFLFYAWRSSGFSPSSFQMFGPKPYKQISFWLPVFTVPFYPKVHDHRGRLKCTLTGKSKALSYDSISSSHNDQVQLLLSATPIRQSFSCRVNRNLSQITRMEKRVVISCLSTAPQWFVSVFYLLVSTLAAWSRAKQMRSLNTENLACWTQKDVLYLGQQSFYPLKSAARASLERLMTIDPRRKPPGQQTTVFLPFPRAVKSSLHTFWAFRLDLSPARARPKDSCRCLLCFVLFSEVCWCSWCLLIGAF